MTLLLASLLGWGWLNTHWLVTGVLIILIVVSQLTSWRWSLSVAQFYRIGDFVTLLFVVLLLYFAVAHTAQRPVFIILEWLPILFLPVLLVQLYSVNGLLPMGALFYSVRKRKPVPYLDFKLPYAAICLLAAGAANDPGVRYFLLSVVGFSGILWTVRSKNSPIILWAFVIGTAAGLSYWGQQGLQQLHAQVEAEIVDWLTDWQTDPFKSTTRIGDIGKLKLSDKIEFRVQADAPLLLMQSSYDRYLGRSWLATLRVFSEQANFSTANAKLAKKQLQVMQPVKRSTILALPAGTVAIKGLEGASLQYTPLGAVKLTDAPDYVNFQVQYTGWQTSKVLEFDLQLMAEHQSWIAVIKQELQLEGRAPAVIAQAIKHYFQSQFYYTLYSAEQVGADKALEDFMLTKKAGHCEYFAVASVMLLRSYGIPARLANGYAMQEYSEAEQLYIVRRRHAHAWAIAHIDGYWQAVDTTPAQWLSIEEQEANSLQFLTDWFSTAYYKYKQWRYQQALNETGDNNTIWLSITAVLLLILLWRLYLTRTHLQQIRLRQEEPSVIYPGQDSELYLIIKALEGTRQARQKNEALATWVRRINEPELVALYKLHYQYRFDSTTFGSVDRKQLMSAVQQWLALHG
ncbi:MAG: protein-glutamine gamma-glutamyltransferase [Methyloprofundus sp.]|nr:MAG: protein-glutamine gamma-glutamyltransferase [Methyloprofundus sp.]